MARADLITEKSSLGGLAVKSIWCSYREPKSSFQTPPRGGSESSGGTHPWEICLQHIISLPRNLSLRKNQECVDVTSTQ